MRLELFTKTLRTLTLAPRPYPTSNMDWKRFWTWIPWSPWSCIKFLPGNSVINKVGLWNPGFMYWWDHIRPNIDFANDSFIVSIFGTKDELLQMVRMLNQVDGIVAVEVNVSCPNTGKNIDQIEEIVKSVRVVADASRHPIFVKLSYGQKYLEIARRLRRAVEGFSVNSVPIEKVDPLGKPEDRPLYHLERRLGGGGGGISGVKAQQFNWRIVADLTRENLPVLAPSIMSWDDFKYIISQYNPIAVAFGAIHIRRPWLPTSIARRDMRERRTP